MGDEVSSSNAMARPVMASPSAPAMWSPRASSSAFMMVPWPYRSIVPVRRIFFCSIRTP